MRGTTLHGYTNTTFPTQNAYLSALKVLAVNYYDSYDFDYNGVRDFKYDSTVAANNSSLWDVRGLATGSKRLVVGATRWLYTYAFYDKYNRVIQTRSNNNLTSVLDSINSTVTIDNLVTSIYDFEKITKSVTHHNAGGSNQVDITQRPVYDQKNRLTQVYHKIGTSTEQLLAQYEYNDLGQVVDKKLHYNTTTSSFLQSVDFRFAINGWLTSINNAALNTDSRNDDTNDYFGMELLYNTVDGSLGNTGYHNGDISAVKWKVFGEGNTATGERSYKYSYDKTDQLTAATFQAYGASAWDQEANSLNESMTYDENGNILSLLRKENKRTYSDLVTFSDSPRTIDSLFYSYTSGAGNQLAGVADGSASTEGFNDGNTSGTDYTYDSNGNLIADANKGIDAISYNLFGKANEILFHDGHNVKYTYDAAGTKVRMATKVGSTTTTTDYVGGFVYQNDTLNYFSSPEGRVALNAGSFEYQYSIADNMGNTRVLFSSATPVASVVTAGFEDRTDEAPEFNYYGLSWPYGPAHGGTNACWLQGNAGNQIAVAKSYHLYAGDTIELSGYAYSNGITCCKGSPNIANFGTVLLSAFGLSAPGVGETNTASSAIANIGSQASTGYGDGTDDNTDARVFFNILIFDKQYNLIDVKSQQVHNDSEWDFIDLKYAAPAESFAYAYIATEDSSYWQVFIDDVTMRYTPSRVIQYNEYYPFGLQTAKSWSRPSKTENKLLYDQASELNRTTGFYDLPYRNYDPAVGRFFQVDGQASRSANMTPYHYAGNNPVGFNDPSGLHRVEPNSYWGPMYDPLAGGSWWDDDSSGGGGGGPDDPIDTDGDGQYSIAEIVAAFIGGLLSDGDATSVAAADEATSATDVEGVGPDQDNSSSGLTASSEATDPTVTVADANNQKTDDPTDMMKDDSGLPEEDSQGDPNKYLEISNDFTKTKIDYSQADGVGALATFTISGHYSVSKEADGKYYFGVSAAGISLAQSQGDVTFNGDAALMVNGQLAGHNSFVYADGYNPSSPPGFSAIGSTSIELPASGTVMINLNFNYNISYGSAGNGVSGTLTVPVYIRTLGLPRN